jgi:hypothetical protein
VALQPWSDPILREVALDDLLEVSHSREQSSQRMASSAAKGGTRSWPPLTGQVATARPVETAPIRMVAQDDCEFAPGHRRDVIPAAQQPIGVAVPVMVAVTVRLVLMEEKLGTAK